MKNECTVIKCNVERIDIDNLFCNHHRNDWINFCIVNQIHEKQISEIQLIQALKLFQEKIQDG